MKRVVIGLSGGVDSSVAAYLLKQQGYDVVGLFMINWHDTTGTLEGDCPWHDDRLFAELVARRLDIPLHITDLSAEYRRRVVDYMFAEYERGRTPNPDVLCNREIKFDVFMKEAFRLGADYVATGHYCRKAEELRPDGGTTWRLLAGSDPGKDQSYFLCQLSQEQLRPALFPVGGLLKFEVRRIAAEQGLATAKRKDSQGICFVGKVDLPLFLQQKLAARRGNVHEILATWPKYAQRPPLPEPGCEPTTAQLAALAEPWHYTVRDGKKIGEHNGAHFYTIGQRKGLGIGGPPRVALHPGYRRGAERHLCRRGRRPPGPLPSCAAHPSRGDALGQPHAGARTRRQRPLPGADTLPPAVAAGHPLRARRRGLHPLRRAAAGHHPRAVRRLVRRRGARRLGRHRPLGAPGPRTPQKATAA